MYELRPGSDGSDIATFLGMVSRPSGRGRAAYLLQAVDGAQLLARFGVASQDPATILTSREVARVPQRVTCLGTLLTGTDTHVCVANLRRLVLVVCPNGKTIEVYRQYPTEEQLVKMQKRKRRAQEKLKKKHAKLAELQRTFESLEAQCGQGKRTAIGTTFDAEKETVSAQLALLSEEMETLKADSAADVPHVSDELEYIQTLFLPKKPVSVDFISMNNEGTLVAAYGDNSVEMFKIPVAKLLERKPVAHAKEAKDVADDDVAIEKLRRIDAVGHDAPPAAACVSHDDATLASFADKAIHLWRTDTAAHIRRIDVGEKVTCGFFVAGSRHVVVGTAKGTLVLVDLVACTTIQSLDTGSRIAAIAEHPKKTGFVVALADKVLALFQFYMTEGDSVGFRSLETLELMDVPLDVKVVV